MGNSNNMETKFTPDSQMMNESETGKRKGFELEID